MSCKETRQELDQYIESLCNEIYTIAIENKIPVVLMHQDNIYIQDDDCGTSRLMMDNLDKTINN